jgi:DNA polymerase III alpha subunit
LLARNLQGYQNLLKLVSDSHLRGFYYKPRADFETLAKYAGGLIGFTGCLAALVPQHLLHNRFEDARKATARYIDLFGRENYFVEIQDHGIPEQRQIIPGLLKLAEEFQLQVICTNDVHYVRHEDAEPHDALLCIQTGAKIADTNRMRFSGTQFYLKSAAEMARLFAEIPESLNNTLAVAETLPAAPAALPPALQAASRTLRDTLTRAVAKAVAAATANGAKSIIGGGDSVKAVNKAKLGDQVTFMSTGGGASLEFLEGTPLPGVTCLDEQ